MKHRTALRPLRVLGLVALVMVLLVQVPSPDPRSVPPGSSPTAPLTSFRTDASAAEVQASGAEILESYNAFIVARGDDRSLALLKAEGRYANPLEGSSTLQLLGGSVDVSALSLQPAAAWPIDPGGETVGVVHF